MPRALYEGDAVQQGAEGIEVKASRFLGQGTRRGVRVAGWFFNFAIMPAPSRVYIRAGTDNRGCRHAREAGQGRLDLLRPCSREPEDTHGVSRPVWAAETPRREDLRSYRNAGNPCWSPGEMAGPRQSGQLRNSPFRHLGVATVLFDPDTVVPHRDAAASVAPEPANGSMTMPSPSGSTVRTTCRRKAWGFRLGWGANRRSSGRVGLDWITSPKGCASDTRRSPPVLHFLRLSCTRPSSGLRKSSQGSYIDLGNTVTS